MADVNINKFRASVVRDGSKPASPGFIVSEGQDPVDPAGNGQNHLPVTIATAATGLSITDSQVLGGAGTVGQYIRGDGSLADFPQASGGGSSVSYYLNGSISQGTIGGVAYKELNKVPILGAGTDFTINADGYIASFLTDAGDPNLLEIPGGNWNFETYFSASSSGGSPSFYVELYKYDGTTFTLIASSSSSPELIAFGTNLNPYFSTLAVPTTTLALTDRLAVRYYVTHSGRTITLHTENNHLCQVVTTFTTGLTSLNGLTAQVQNLAVGTSGTDFNIASATATHTFNLPTASATNRGALSSADWTTFNNKQNALTNPVTGTGTTNYLPKFTGASTIGNSQVFDSGTGVVIGGAATTNGFLEVIKSGSSIAQFSFGQSTTYRTDFFVDATGNFYIQPQGTTKATLLASGNFGIGIETPSCLLQINDPASGSTKTLTKYTCGDGGDIRVGKESGVNNDAIFGTWSNNSVVFYANSVEAMRITNGRNVEIGTYSFTSPSGADRFVGVYGAQDCSLILQDNVQLWELYVNDDLFINRGSTNVLTLNRLTGNVLINSNTDSGFKLDVNGTARFSDGTQGLIVRAYTAADGWGAIYPVGVTPSSSNYTLIAKSTNAVLNASTSVTLAVGDSGKLTANSTGISVTGIYTLNGTFTFTSSAQVSGSFQSGATTPYWQFQSTGAGATGYIGFGNSLISGAGATDFILRSDNALKFAIGATSALSIATNSSATFSSSITSAFFGINALASYGFTSYAGSSASGNNITFTTNYFGGFDAIYQSSGNTNDFGIWTNGGASTAAKLYVKNNGNVLIGTSTDNGARLQVSGTARINGNLTLETSSLILGLGNGGSNEAVYFNYNSNAASRSWRIIKDWTAFGDFQIQQSTTQTGTTYADILRFSPAGAATFTGNIIIDKNFGSGTAFQAKGGSDNSVRASISFDTDYSTFSSGSNRLKLFDYSGTGIVIDNGKVLIGTTTDNSHKLRVNGDLWVDGIYKVPVNSYFICGSSGYRFNNTTDAFNNFVALDNGNATLRGTLTQNASDERLKNNIEIIPNAIDKIKQLRGVTFKWNQELYETSRTFDIGVIAQEVEQVLPNAVCLAPFDTNFDDNTSKSGQNYLTVYYEKLIPLLIEGIKELKQEIDTLKN